jgi:hypothetical protein
LHVGEELEQPLDLIAFGLKGNDNGCHGKSPLF